MGDNRIKYARLEEGGLWLIRIPSDLIYKEGDTVDVYVDEGMINHDKVLGSFVYETKHDRYYKQGL